MTKPQGARRRNPRQSTNPVVRWGAKLVSFDVASLFTPRRPKPRPRSVLVNEPAPSHSRHVAPKVPIPFWKREVTTGETTHKVNVGLGSRDAPTPGWVFPSNQVLTSKYNVFTFLPRNLLEQFRRVANIFFLALVILQFFPRFTQVSPGLSALPLIVVLAITAIKDGYEDIKRHQSDHAINTIKVLTLRGSFQNMNVSAPKARTFGMPKFITNLFVGRTVAQQESDEDAERKRMRKRFWGRRKVKKADLARKRREGSAAPGDEAEKVQDGPAEVPRAAPGGGTVQDAREEAANGETVQQKETLHGPGPREPGDYYADDDGTYDEHDDSRISADAHSRMGLHTPHVPHLLGGSHPTKPIWTEINWEDLKVGDFVRLRNDESVPADIAICATSEEENVCYVETKNLDGETNLKARSAVPELAHIRTSTTAADSRFHIDAEAADVSMIHFNAAAVLGDGRMGKDGQPLKSPITLNTMLLRGTVVRNTDWVIGVVVMTGIDTKIVLNSGGTPSKRSRVEIQMNPMVFINLGLLALMCLMCSVVDYFLELEYEPRGAPWLWGANRPGDNPSANAGITFANAMIAFQNIVPISLYISIEFVRLVQAFFIWADDDIYYKTSTMKRRTTARSWNLSDDLGQVEYIFSDKTGTLTQNAMLFRQCSVNGVVYEGEEEQTSAPEPDTLKGSVGTSSDSGNGSSSADDGKRKVKLADQVLAPFHDARLLDDLHKTSSSHAAGIRDFFINLALCHTVLAADEDGLIAYKAQSPDEAALVQAAADVGFVFLGRDKNILKLQTPMDRGVLEYELLNVLEFTSARKRMSVVVRRIYDDGSHDGLLLLSKGADNIIFERLGEGMDDVKKDTDQHLSDFANQGLRTLCLAQRPLEDDEYDMWEREYHEATTALDNREDKIDAVSEKLERDLHLLGATAIEDRLQDGVPEAIADLKRAGIKIWVATGDKLETAIAIGKTCNLITRDMNLIIVKGGSEGPQATHHQIDRALSRFFNFDASTELGLMRSKSRPSFQRHRTNPSIFSDVSDEENGQKPGGWGLVIDGAALRHAFGDADTKELLLELAIRCESVVCCRTSPLQKAQIVRLVKDGLGSLCLAIGDGANDVSMIQAADLGIGIAGEEGLQAVNSSDYAIAQFRYLKRLVLVHGHLSYMRNGTMIVNFFYKEIIGIGILFWFQFYCGYSATTVYEYTFILFWNVFWTLVPVIFIGIFDRNVSDHVLMALPELYRYGREGTWFGLWRFSIYMLDGIYQSAVCYFLLLYPYDTASARPDGYEVSMYEFSTIMCITAVYACNFYNGINTHGINWWVMAGVLIGPVLITCYTAVYAAFPPTLLWTQVYGYNNFWWPAAYFWLGILMTFLVSLLPFCIYKYVQENYFPTDLDILRWIDKNDPKHDWDNDPAMPHVQHRMAMEKEQTPHFYPDRPAFDQNGKQQQRPGTESRASIPLDRVRTSMSLHYDMASGAASPGLAGRGYGFDQAENMLPAPIARYTSRGSNRTSIQSRPRKGSVKLGRMELNPFLRTPHKSGQHGGNQGRNRSSSFRQIFGSTKRSPAQTGMLTERAGEDDTEDEGAGEMSMEDSPPRGGHRRRDDDQDDTTQEYGIAR